MLLLNTEGTPSSSIFIHATKDKASIKWVPPEKDITNNIDITNNKDRRQNHLGYIEEPIAVRSKPHNKPVC